MSSEWPPECKLDQTLWKLYRVRRNPRNAKDEQLSNSPKPDEYLAAWTTQGFTAQWKLAPGRYKLRMLAVAEEGREVKRLQYEFSLAYPKPGQQETDEGLAMNYLDFLETTLDSLAHSPNARGFLVKIRDYLVENERTIMQRLRLLATDILAPESGKGPPENVLFDALAAGIKRLSICRRDAVTELKHHIRCTVEDLRNFLFSTQDIQAGSSVTKLAQQASISASDLNDEVRALRLNPTEIKKVAKQIENSSEPPDSVVTRFAIQKQVFQAVDSWFPEWSQSNDVWGEDLFQICRAVLESRLHITNMLNRLGFYTDRDNNNQFKGLDVATVEAVVEAWFRDGTDLRGYDSEGAFFVVLDEKVRNFQADQHAQRGNVQELFEGQVPDDLQASEGELNVATEVVRIDERAEVDAEAFHEGIQRAAELEAARAQKQGRRKINPASLAEKMKRQVTPTLTLSIFNHQTQQGNRIELPIDRSWEIGRQTREEVEILGAWQSPFIDETNSRIVLASLDHNTFSKRMMRILPTYMQPDYAMLGRTVAIQNLSSNYDLCLSGAPTGTITIHPDDAYVTGQHLYFYYQVSEAQRNDDSGPYESSSDPKLFSEFNFSVRIDIAFKELEIGQMSEVLIARNEWIGPTGSSTLMQGSISHTRPPRSS